MDYKTILIVVVILGLPTIILVIAKLISMIRRGRVNPAESDSGEYELDSETGEIKFGNGESGKRPPTLNDEVRGSYESGAGGNQSIDPGLTTMEVFDYLEEAVTCRDPAGRESFEELLEQDDSSDESDVESREKNT